jgi:hypothetical protein
MPNHDQVGMAGVAPSSPPAPSNLPHILSLRLLQSQWPKLPPGGCFQQAQEICPSPPLHSPSHSPAAARRPTPVDQSSTSGTGHITILPQRHLDVERHACSWCSFPACRPPCFDREPARHDSFFRYDDFEAFSLPSNGLNRAWEFHLPRELVSHDVTEEDW